MLEVDTSTVGRLIFGLGFAAYRMARAKAVAAA
jgi:hypothetical protein